MRLGRQKAGYALVIVLGLTAVLTILLTVALVFSGTQLRIAAQQTALERALYVAQAGAERAAAFVANGGSGPWSSSGTVGDGVYVVAVIPAALPSSAPRTLGGWVTINPASGSGYEFVLRQPDGTMLDNFDFNEDYPGYTGPAAYVHIKPAGTGSQTDLMVDGSPYILNNTYTYDIFASAMDVYLYNDTIDQQGKAKGKWKISIATSCASLVVSF